MSQADLARALGPTAKGAVSRLLNAERTMGLDIFARLHTKLGLDANRLLDEDPPRRYFDASMAPSRLALELEAIAGAKEMPDDLAQRLERVVKGLRGKRERKL